MLRNLFSIAILSFSVAAHAVDLSSRNVSEASLQDVESTMANLAQNSDTRQRALIASEHLLGKPFVSGPEGEGSYGRYETKPILSLEGFDCTTFVEAVLGFAFASPTGSDSASSRFFKTFLNIKYSDTANIRYNNRNHFPELHWIPNVITKGYLRDITTDLDPGAELREKDLNVAKWYQDKIDKVNAVASDTDRDAKVDELREVTPNKQVSNHASLRYISLSALLDPEIERKLGNERIVVFNMVRGEHTKIDIPVIVGHQGFIVSKDGKLFIRQASIGGNKVTEDRPYEDYVRERMKDTTWPSLGFNILKFASAAQ